MIWLIDIEEEVASYVRFTAPDDETAMIEAEKLWDDGVVNMDWDVADVWEFRLVVSSEAEKYEQCFEDDYGVVSNVETVVDRFPDADNAKTYYARYLGTRSVSTSYGVYPEEESFGNLGDAFKKAVEYYRDGKFHNDRLDKVCVYGSVVEVFRDGDLTVDGFVGDQYLSEIC